MEIIDAYCGVGPWQTRDPLLPWRTGEIVGLLDHFGVNRALVHSNFINGGGHSARGNEHVAEACRECDRLIPVWNITPYQHEDEPTLSAQFEAMRRAGARAVWFHPVTNNVRSWIYGELLDACMQQRLPVFVSGERVGSEDVATIMATCPKLRLVLCSLGYRDDWWTFPLMRRYDTLMICTGHFYIPTYNPMRFLKSFGSDRLLFGSGLPHFSPGGMVTHISYADISETDRRNILSGNVLRLLEEAWS